MTIEENLDPELVAKLNKGREQAEKGEGKIVQRRPSRAKVEETEPRPEPVKEQAPKSPYAVVGGGKRDTVLATVDAGSGKSLSVHHIQRRLAERGHSSVFRDRDGFWREGTTDALNDYVEAQKLDGSDRLAVLKSLFENDDNVEVVEEA